MHRIMIAALAMGSALTASPALATERMNDIEYLRAVRCLAYVAATDNPHFNAQALAAEVSEQGSRREPYIRERARREGRAILREGRRADDDLEQARFDRDLRSACAAFAPMIAGLDPRA
jgi:hypothetical protein